MKTASHYVVVRLDFEYNPASMTEDQARNLAANECDYSFQSTFQGVRITDTEIVAGDPHFDGHSLGE